MSRSAPTSYFHFHSCTPITHSYYVVQSITASQLSSLCNFAVLHVNADLRRLNYQLSWPLPSAILFFFAASIGVRSQHLQHMTMRLILAVLCAVLRLGTALSIPSVSSNGNAPPNVLVVGGSSGMGKAAAVAAVQRGGKALIISRSKDKLEKAAQEIREKAGKDNDDDKSCVTTAVLDATDEAAVERFASEIDSECWDGLVVSAAGRAPHGPVTTLPTESTRDLFESKFWTAYHCAKHIGPRLREGGAITFVAGVLNRRPGMNCVPLATTNGALEGLTRALALEMGPRLRVNCLSPGFCDTERFDHMDPERKAAMLDNTADSLPLKRTGQPEDMGEAIFYLLTAKFCTGVVLDVDGGHGIRQYANPTSDPMRQQQQK